MRSGRVRRRQGRGEADGRSGFQPGRQRGRPKGSPGCTSGRGAERSRQRDGGRRGHVRVSRWLDDRLQQGIAAAKARPPPGRGDGRQVTTPRRRRGVSGAKLGGIVGIGTRGRSGCSASSACCAVVSGTRPPATARPWPRPCGPGRLQVRARMVADRGCGPRQVLGQVDSDDGARVPASGWRRRQRPVRADASLAARAVHAVRRRPGTEMDASSVLSGIPPGRGSPPATASHGPEFVGGRCAALRAAPADGRRLGRRAVEERRPGMWPGHTSGSGG